MRVPSSLALPAVRALCDLPPAFAAAACTVVCAIVARVTTRTGVLRCAGSTRAMALLTSVVARPRRRFYVNGTYYSPSSPLVFIEIGGEGPLSSYPTGFIAQLAQQHSALLVSLEHRFYGGAHT